jgi:tetratricopeptide (TPR) repeat protein
MASAAAEQFDIVLRLEPDNQLAMASEAALYFNQKKLDEAATWYKKLIVVAPNSQEAFYTLGVIAWTRVQGPIQEARQDAGMKPEDAGPIRDARVRGALRTNYMPVVAEGMDNLSEALALNPEYTDAMAYMKLLYRVKADLEDPPQAYAEDMAQADRWFQRTIDTRKTIASRK